MTKLYVLGLTGSIGMGKTTTANMFRDAGIPVWDADAAVHELYTKDQALIQAIAKLTPNALVNDIIDRHKLKEALIADSFLLQKIEEIVHPAVRKHRSKFIEQCKQQKKHLAVVDIPLLFETNAQTGLDGVLVVTIDPKTQKERVLSRNTMAEETFEMILNKQMPDDEKRKRADYVIETTSMADVRLKVNELIGEILKNA